MITPLQKIMSEQQNLSEFNRYLINNRDLLVEKYREYFSKGGAQTLRTVPAQALIDYIYDIFSFAKYKHNESTNNKIVQSLRCNVNQFIAANAPRHQEVFTPQLAIQTLTYCITHNDMFSVQYDVEKPSKPKSNGEEASTQPTFSVEIRNQFSLKGEKSHQLAQNQSNAVRQQRGTTKQLTNSTHIHNHQNIKSNVNQRLRKSNLGINRFNGSQTEVQNEFNQKSEIIQFSQNLDIVKKNAKLVYSVYCKNQMELGGQQTFDRLEEESSTMTIGKLLVYAKAYKMFNDKITKELLIQRFRKISDGKRAMNFQKFYIMMTELLTIDPDLFVRLQLFDQSLYLRVKFVKYPFYTQDQKPRELVPMRGFTNKLTAHSGKTQDQLKEQIQQRKLELRQKKGAYLRYSSVGEQPTKSPKSKLLSPRDLAIGAKSRNFSIQLSFIDKIVSPEDTDQKYLMDYQIDHYYPKDSEPAISKSSYSLSRKDSIVQNIRKRISQIENSENDTTRHAPYNYLKKRKVYQ